MIVNSIDTRIAMGQSVSERTVRETVDDCRTELRSRPQVNREKYGRTQMNNMSNSQVCLDWNNDRCERVNCFKEHCCKWCFDTAGKTRNHREYECQSKKQ